MKRLLAIYLLLFTTLSAVAQYPGNANDWVEYDKTYYRFGITEDGIYRLTKADLEAAGMNSADLVGADFKMIRNGEEVPLYVTTTGSFGANDFIEFLGKKNDGTADTPLYPSELQQPGTSKSLFSDQSVHFLTVDDSGSHLRIMAIDNDLTNLPTKENYFIDEVIEYSGGYDKGKYVRFSSTNLFQSIFDNCEGYNQRINNNATKSFDFPASNVYEAASEPVTIDFKVASRLIYSTPQPGVIEVTLGDSNTEDINIPGTFAYTAFQRTYSAADLGNARLKIRNATPVHVFVPEKRLSYPRTFEFADHSFYHINLDKGGSSYIELENLPSTGSVVVYDRSNNSRITEAISGTTPIRTAPNSTGNDLVFDVQIDSPSFLSSVTFEDYNQSTYDMVLITHSALEEPVNGENYVEKYINHRTSPEGGSLSVLKVDVEQIIDQYAYGIAGHNAAIKNFTAELKQGNHLPKYVLLMGKGYEYQLLYNNDLPNHYVPTFGEPGSDSQLVADYGSNDLNCAVARISAKTPQQLQHYIDKVIEYETLMGQTDDVYQTKDKLWMKNAMHLGGGRDVFEQNGFKNILNNYASVYENPYFGGNVTSFFKNSTDPIQTSDVASIDSLINSGVAVINYFGHSAVNSLEFGINDFSVYDHEGKYPFMLTNGCFVGDLYQVGSSLSEDFVLEDNAGTLSFMGPSQFGIASGMNAVCNAFYDFFVEDEYGIPIGEAVQRSQNAQADAGSLIRILTKQQMIFHGDPTLSIYKHEKPDYLLSEEDVIFEPGVITTDVEEFTAHVVVSNIGKAIDEPVSVTITRIFPNGEEESQTVVLDHVYFQEEASFTFVTDPLRAEGVNQFTVQIDKDDQLDEITRANNNLGTPVSVPIINDAVKPIFPTAFGITNDTNVELVSYTSRFTATAQNFDVQIDTTELFNSGELLAGTVSSNGGTITWQPGINLENERVYYWRVKKQGDESEWSGSSFVFLNDYEEGWNQSHYFQFLKDDYNKFYLDDSRLFEFGVNNRTLNVRTGLLPYIPRNQVSYSIDGLKQADWGRCWPNERRLGMAIIDENTGIPLQNENLGGGVGLYNSVYCSRAINLFHYQVHTPEGRANFIDAVNSIEDGKYVLIYSQTALNPVEFDWAASNDIREVLQENGAQHAYDIVDNASYAFFFQKGNPDFESTSDIATSAEDEILDQTYNMPVKFPLGDMTTKLIGPAASWDTFMWSWDNSYDNIAEGDEISYSIIGVSADEVESVLASGLTDLTHDLSQYSASDYPYLKIKVDFEDSENFSPAQLQYLRVIYESLPEMALNITSIAQTGDLQFEQYQPMSLTFSLDNIHTKDMSPVLVSYTVTQGAGAQLNEEVRYDELPAGQSQSVNFELNTSDAATLGTNILYIDANPDDDQPEQYHFNNIALIEFDVNKDVSNPYLDVTFDGIHIIDGDLVADTPEIIISLTDENEYLLLDNPDDFEIVVTAPNGDQTTYLASSPEITFYPASDLDDNSAKIEFKPEFAPGVYTMRVQATDRSNNQAGRNDYLITFEVTDEDIITQIINYPNPFTTSTEFIARIIGEAPDEVLIQIFSPSGQVIRELHSYAGDITLSQGNNYYSVAHWDGTDEFGDPIGNGVYFYKISMKRNGEMIDAYDSENYSEYFHNGIGKLYILR